MNYYDKYIKYKNKYINLKNMIGSGSKNIPEHQQVKYLKCPNLWHCPSGGKGPFISTYCGKNPTCQFCKNSIVEINFS